MIYFNIIYYIIFDHDYKKMKVKYNKKLLNWKIKIQILFVTI